MERQIEYAKDIIVGVRRNGGWSWYLSEKEPWFLDYRKWGALFGASETEAENAESRFGIAVVDEHTAGQFLEHMKPHLISTDELRRMLQKRRAEAPHDYVEYLPSLFVDFDRKIFRSNYYEPVYPEKFVPDGWAATYGDFLEDVPDGERYWT
jgi:hypothetical protein